MYTCPVCGDGNLDLRPYETWPPPAGVVLVPPYEYQLGAPSYDVCPVCEFEFGNDDNPGTAPPTSFEEYRAEWQEAQRESVRRHHLEKFGSFVTRLARLRTGGPIVGCTAEEVQAAVQWHGAALPAAFEAFLLTMGRRGGALWRAEADHFFPGILDLTPEEIRALADDLGVTLPEGTILPLATHDGYEYQWLLLDDGPYDDPPVWQLLDWHGPPVKRLSDTLTGYLDQQIAATEHYVATHPEWTFP